MYFVTATARKSSQVAPYGSGKKRRYSLPNSQPKGNGRSKWCRSKFYKRIP